MQNEIEQANLEEINDLSPQLIENTEERQSLLDEEAEMVNKAKKHLKMLKKQLRIYLMNLIKMKLIH